MKKYGVDKICFTHKKGCVLYASKNGWDGECTASSCNAYELVTFAVIAVPFAISLFEG